MSEKVVAFGNIEIEKRKLHRCKNVVLLERCRY